MFTPKPEHRDAHGVCIYRGKEFRREPLMAHDSVYYVCHLHKDKVCNLHDSEKGKAICWALEPKQGGD